MVGKSPGGSRPERGAAAVEFALVVPLLLLLVFGVLGYGYMLSFRQALSQAAAEAARSAAVTPEGVSSADRRLRAVEAVNSGLDSYGVRCDAAGRLMRGGEESGECTISDPVPCVGATADAECVEVSLTYRYRDHSLLPTLGLGVVLPGRIGYRTKAEVSS